MPSDNEVHTAASESPAIAADSAHIATTSDNIATDATTTTQHHHGADNVPPQTDANANDAAASNSHNSDDAVTHAINAHSDHRGSRGSKNALTRDTPATSSPALADTNATDSIATDSKSQSRANKSDPPKAQSRSSLRQSKTSLAAYSSSRDKLAQPSDASALHNAAADAHANQNESIHDHVVSSDSVAANAKAGSRPNSKPGSRVTSINNIVAADAPLHTSSGATKSSSQTGLAGTTSARKSASNLTNRNQSDQAIAKSSQQQVSSNNEIATRQFIGNLSKKSKTSLRQSTGVLRKSAGSLHEATSTGKTNATHISQSQITKSASNVAASSEKPPSRQTSLKSNSNQGSQSRLTTSQSRLANRPQIPASTIVDNAHLATGSNRALDADPRDIDGRESVAPNAPTSKRESLSSLANNLGSNDMLKLSGGSKGSKRSEPNLRHASGNLNHSGYDKISQVVEHDDISAAGTNERPPQPTTNTISGSDLQGRKSRTQSIEQIASAKSVSASQEKLRGSTGKLVGVGKGPSRSQQSLKLTGSKTSLEGSQSALRKAGSKSTNVASNDGLNLHGAVSYQALSMTKDVIQLAEQSFRRANDPTQNFEPGTYFDHIDSIHSKRVAHNEGDAKENQTVADANTQAYEDDHEEDFEYDNTNPQQAAVDVHTNEEEQSLAHFGDTNKLPTAVTLTALNLADEIMQKMTAGGLDLDGSVSGLDSRGALGNTDKAAPERQGSYLDAIAEAKQAQMSTPSQNLIIASETNAVSAQETTIQHDSVGQTEPNAAASYSLEDFDIPATSTNASAPAEPHLENAYANDNFQDEHGVVDDHDQVNDKPVAPMSPTTPPSHQDMQLSDISIHDAPVTASEIAGTHETDYADAVYSDNDFIDEPVAAAPETHAAVSYSQENVATTPLDHVGDIVKDAAPADASNTDDYNLDDFDDLDAIATPNVPAAYTTDNNMNTNAQQPSGVVEASEPTKSTDLRGDVIPLSKELQIEVAEHAGEAKASLQDPRSVRYAPVPVARHHVVDEAMDIESLAFGTAIEATTSKPTLAETTATVTAATTVESDAKLVEAPIKHEEEQPSSGSIFKQFSDDGIDKNGISDPIPEHDDAKKPATETNDVKRPSREVSFSSKVFARNYSKRRLPSPPPELGSVSPPPIERDSVGGSNPSSKHRLINTIPDGGIAPETIKLDDATVSASSAKGTAVASKAGANTVATKSDGAGAKKQRPGSAGPKRHTTPNQTKPANARPKASLAKSVIKTKTPTPASTKPTTRVNSHQARATSNRPNTSPSTGSHPHAAVATPIPRPKPSQNDRIDYTAILASLRKEIRHMRVEIDARDNSIEQLQTHERQLKAHVEEMKRLDQENLEKNVRLLLARQKKDYQIAIAMLKRQIRHLMYQRNSMADPLIEAKYFPYLPRTEFSNSARKPLYGIIGNLPPRSSDYFSMNPPVPTGNHPESGHRWWWDGIHGKSNRAHSARNRPDTIDTQATMSDPLAVPFDLDLDYNSNTASPRNPAGVDGVGINAQQAALPQQHPTGSSAVSGPFSTSEFSDQSLKHYAKQMSDDIDQASTNVAAGATASPASSSQVASAPISQTNEMLTKAASQTLPNQLATRAKTSKPSPLSQVAKKNTSRSGSATKISTGSSHGSFINQIRSRISGDGGLDDNESRGTTTQAKYVLTSGSNSNQPGTVEQPQVGDRVCVVINDERCLGVLKYSGPFESGSPGIWCGIQLDRPLGTHDGTVRGYKYFDCKENHGIFVKQDKIIVVKHTGQHVKQGTFTSSVPIVASNVPAAVAIKS